MPRSVTVQFSDGTVRVYNNVPDEVTFDQLEDRAINDNPDRPIARIIPGNIINRELRNAIASRQATVADLQAIAQRYGGELKSEELEGYQRWIDFAADNPEYRIPDDIHAAPTGVVGSLMEGAESGARSISDTLVGAWAWLADKAAELGITPTPENATRIFARVNAYSPEEADAFARNIAERGLSWSDLVSAGSEAVRQRPSAVEAQVHNPIPTAVGEGGAQIGLTAVPLTVAARSIAALAPAGSLVSNAANAFAQGGVGVRTMAPGAPATVNAIAAGVPVAASTTGNIGLRAFGGAAPAVVGSAVTGGSGEDALLEGLVGGTIPFGATLVRRGAGSTYDLIARRFGDVRAAEIFRNLIAENAAEITAALREAPANARANVVEFLASRRVVDPVTNRETSLLTPEIAAATRAVTASSAGRPLQLTAQDRAAGQTELLNIVRGGETETEAVAGTRAAREALREETQPMLQAVKERADIGRTQIIPAERNAARLNAIADELAASGLVRRMRDLEGRSREQLDTMFQNPSFFTLDGPAARTGEIADQAGRRADEGIDAQISLRDQARAQAQIAANLRAQGLSPLDITGVVGNLRRQARQAADVAPQREKILTEFANSLERRAARYGGVIDAEGLHLAKRNMGEFVSNVLGQSDPSAIARGTSMLTGEAQDLIDDAFTAAAGPEWGEYNKLFSAGMRDIERTEFGRRLAGLPRARLERVLSGGDPDFVADVFGPGRFDINAELTDVQRPAANELLNQIRADRNIAALDMREIPTETRGPVVAGINARVRDMFQPGARNAFMRGLSRIAAGAPGIYGGGVAADQLAREFSQTIKENTMARLAPALADPAAALRLLPVRSANAMTAGAFDRLGPTARGFVGQSAQQLLSASSTPPPVVDIETYPGNQVFLGFQIGPDGQQYPIYGPAGGR